MDCNEILICYWDLLLKTKYVAFVVCLKGAQNITVTFGLLGENLLRDIWMMVWCFKNTKIDINNCDGLLHAFVEYRITKNYSSFTGMCKRIPILYNIFLKMFFDHFNDVTILQK